MDYVTSYSLVSARRWFEHLELDFIPDESNTEVYFDIVYTFASK
jgi:hypothetical protein